MTPEQQIARTRKLVSSARAVLSGNVGLSVGVFRIRNNFDRLDRELNATYPVFKEYESQIPPGVPVGTVRLRWELNAMMNTDYVLKQLEFAYREKVFEACIDIIRKYG